MKNPPDYLMPLMLSIEEVTLKIHREFPRMASADIEWCYEKLSDYFKMKSKNNAAPEPESTSEMKQALLDEILNNLDAREEAEEETDLINNPGIRYGEHMILSLDKLYFTVFKSLKDSARFWRKKDGRNGYINHITGFLDQIEKERNKDK